MVKWLIVGLGNPGKKYETTRHNFGFLALDMLADRLPEASFSKKYAGLWGKTTLNDTEVHLLKPQTFMNKSGESVRACAQFFKIKPENIVVVYDDVDLPFEAIRIREKGTAGTHNGMKSVIQHLGSPLFPRIRLGIGPVDEKWDLSAYVLSPFSDKEWDKLPEILEKTADAIEILVEKGPQNAMLKINKKV